MRISGSKYCDCSVMRVQPVSLSRDFTDQGHGGGGEHEGHGPEVAAPLAPGNAQMQQHRAQRFDGQHHVPRGGHGEQAPGAGQQQAHRQHDALRQQRRLDHARANAGVAQQELHREPEDRRE
jgi:hypothetical protein